MIKLGIINKSNNPLPEYQTSGSSGMDLMAWLPESEITLMPGERTLIHTGLYFEIPDNYELQIRSRSGLSLKRGLIVLNEPGTIDSDYRGELGIILYNASSEPQTITNGDRVAQMVIAKVEKAILNEVIGFESTERGEGGFGHTGVKRK